MSLASAKELECGLGEWRAGYLRTWKSHAPVRRGVLHVAPVLARDECAIAEALWRAQLLCKTVTYTVPGKTWLRWIPTLERGLVPHRPALELDRSVLKPVLFRDIIARTMTLCGARPVRVADVADAILDYVGVYQWKDEITAVVGREGGCSRTFERASKLNAVRIYHLPIAHYGTVRKLLENELALFGDICRVSFDAEIYEPSRLHRKAKELRLANWVLCPSEFVARSAVKAGFPRTNIKVIPYGGLEPKMVESERDRDRVFVCAGNLSARKGVHRLLRVWKALGAYRTHRLRLIGDMHLTEAFLKDYHGMYEHLPRLPQSELCQEFSKAQALVLNSAAEGFAVVIPEAMSYATPVMVSRNSGAEGFVEDGREGRLFDFADDEQLASVLDWALSHPDELREMGCRALERVRDWQWHDFQNEFIKWLISVMR